MAQCALLGGVARYFLQVILLIASLSVLFFKHHWEQTTGRSNRSTARFFFDSSKQLAGAAWMHILNIICAQALSWETRADPCEWYWIEIMVDTTLGVYIEFGMMQFLISLRHWDLGKFDVKFLVDLVQESCMDNRPQPDAGLQQDLLQAEAELEDSSSFGQVWASLNKARYAAQLLVWLLVVTVMKLLMITLIALFGPQLQYVAAYVLGLFKGMPFLELLFVMILTPVLMDAVQFVLQDNIFMDLDEGYLVEKTPKRVQREPRRGSNLAAERVRNEREQIVGLTDDNEQLRLEIAGLRSELLYQRSGFLARIILRSFVGIENDQPGLYRVLEVVQTYQKAEFPLRTFVDPIKPAGKVVSVVEIVTGVDSRGEEVTWAKLHKPADHWILLVNGKKRRCARKLAKPPDELGADNPLPAAAVAVAGV